MSSRPHHNPRRNRQPQGVPQGAPTEGSYPEAVHREVESTLREAEVEARATRVVEGMNQEGDTTILNLTGNMNHLIGIVQALGDPQEE